MQNSLRKMLARMFADKKRQRRIVAVVCVLSVLVTTTVFTELMQPVITMTPDPVCGLAEHVHSSDCFADQLACGVEESGEHAHGDGCYKSVLVCGKSEHSHTEDCYPEKVEEQKVTVIQPTEAPATEAPAAEPTEAPAVMTLSEDEPTEAPATEAPVTEEPTAMSETEPAVEATAEPTVEATEEPTVVPAPAVAVTAVSAEKVFVGQTVTWTVEASGEAELTYYIADESGAEIVSGALDVDASYISWLADRAGAFTLTVTAANETGSASANGSVTVEASEALVAAALVDQLYCFAGEEITFRFAYSGGVEPASVSIAVYQDGQVLTELTEFAETVAVTPANLGEKVTTVTAEITVTDSLGSTVTGVCEIPCAVRTRETESDWEKSTRVDLTGEWPEDLIAVAETQLGYEESEINFIVNDEGERQGYTRYGQWYGSSYAEWCAMFVSFDLNYAEIPEKYFPREANCEKWISALKARSLYESAKGDYEPEVGDLVFFDWEDNDESDHVGIITAVTDKKIETIEGNVDKGVRRCDYDRDDEVLYGYGCVLEAYEKYLCDELDLDLEAGVGAQAIVTAETANLRAEADADSELVAQLAIDTVVDVLAAEQNRAEIWYQVAAGELTGYIRSDLVEINYVAEEELIPVAADYDSLMNRIAELPFDGSEAHALAAAGIADDAAFAYESGVLTYEQYAEIIAALTAGSIMTLEENSEIMTLDEDGKITITFEIDNAAYISDNGTTHVRIESEELYQLFSANGMTTATEAWSGKPGWYKVTSTGILVQFEIDAGSTLSASGYDTPDIEIYDSTNTTLNNSYMSMYSWVSRDAEGNGTVCGVDTVFDTDTTLYLQLYSSDSIYYLDYVCCENCNKSISFATSSLYAHPSISLGSTVGDQYIPKAAAVNSAFECDSVDENGDLVCADTCRTSDNGMVFDHWYLKNTTTNEIVDFDSTVQITADYLNSNYGNAIKVYAVWTDAPEMVSNLTFRDSDYTTLGTVEEVAYGTTINALIEEGLVKAPALDDCEFIGWTFGDGSTIVDGAHKVTASDTTYQAVYKAKVYVKIPDIENGDLNTYSTVEYTVQTGQNLLTAVDADGNSISTILERDTAIINGYVFSGWKLEQGYDSPKPGVTDFSDITANAVVTLTAEYSKAISIIFQFPNNEGGYDVIATYYVKNGGTLYDAVDIDGNPVNGVIPSVPGYTINQWQGSSNTTPPQYANFYSDNVYTAVAYTALPTATFQYTVTGDDTGAVTTTVATVRIPTSGATLADALAAAEGIELAEDGLPVCPQTLPTKYFSHWATADGVAATLDTVITADTTFEAVFADKVHVKFQYSYSDDETGADITGTAAECYVIPGEALSTALTEMPSVNLPANLVLTKWVKMNENDTYTEITLESPVEVAEGVTEITYDAILEYVVSLNFVYQDVMDSDADGDTEEVITHAVYTVLVDKPISTATRTVVGEDGTETVETLSEIPVPPTFENYRFTGWYYSDGEQLTSLEDPAYIDTNFTGVYEKNQGYTVTFHDIDPDGKEKLPEGVASIDVLVPGGEALAGYLPEVALTDRTADEVIKWYTLAEDGSKIEFDPTQPLTADVDLYTYTYRIVLTLAEETTEEEVASLLDLLIPSAYAAEVNVSDDGKTLTIEIADGEKLTYADFVVNGKDYSLYTWTYTDANGVEQTLDIDELVKNGLTESITATADATVTETSMTVEFYAAIDGVWEKVAETGTVYGKTSFPTASGTSSRYYVTLAQIADAYEKYGFDESSYAGEKWFPHWSSNGNAYAWGDVYPTQIDGYWCVPVGDNTQYTIRIYYSPNQVVTGSVSPDTTFAATNAIYSITATDSTGLAYTDDTVVGYVLTGKSKTVTLDTPNDTDDYGAYFYTWNLADSSADACDSIDKARNGATMAVTLNNVTAPVVLELGGPMKYTVTISDPAKLVYTDAADIPTVADVIEGSSFTVTLLNPPIEEGAEESAYYWSITGIAQDDIAITDNGDGTSTYTFTNVMSDINIVLTAPVMYTVRYVIEAEEAELIDIFSDSSGVNYTASAQDWVESSLPTVAGEKPHEDVVVLTAQNNTYEVRRPDSIAATTVADQFSPNNQNVAYKNHDYYFTYLFQTWKIVDADGNTVATVDAETVWSETEFAKYADADGVITLKPDWYHNNNDSDRPNSVTFWVNVSCDINETGASAVDDAGSYTDVVYNTYIIKADGSYDLNYVTTETVGTQEDALIVAGKDDIVDIFDADAAIRALSTTPYNGVIIGSVPSDSYVLTQIAEWMEATGKTITIKDGSTTLMTITDPSELNTQNFLIRWYVLKDTYENTWHIDGKLIYRQGMLRVTKTFYGNDTAIEAAKEDIQITATEKGTNTSYALSMGEHSDANPYGWVEYNDTTDTYTWLLTVKKDTQYTITESGHEVNTITVDDTKVSVATIDEYMTTAEGQWHDYPDDGVTVKAKSYWADTEAGEVDAVNLMNSYIPTNTMILRKVDGNSGQPVGKAVSFILKHDGSVYDKLYYVEATDTYYLYDPNIDGAVHVEDGTVTVGTSGSVVIVGLKEATPTTAATGDFTLSEVTPPTGYNRIPDVKFTITTTYGADNNAESKITADGNVYGNQTYAEATNDYTLRVKNFPMTSGVIAKKEWATGEEQLPVTFQLYRNGVSMGDSYVVELDGTEDTAWTCEWDDLPLYLDGEVADYEIIETWIGKAGESGSTGYDPSADTDGYENYVVTKAEVVYTFEDSTTSSQPYYLAEDGSYVFAKNATLVVSNRKETGKISFSKVDPSGNPVQGATFTLYRTDANGTATTTVQATATSTADGKVDFPMVPSGTYYMMKETGTPDGYCEDTTQYKVIITGTRPVIYAPTTENGETVYKTLVTSIVNVPSGIDLTIKKVSKNADGSETALDGATFQIKLGDQPYTVNGTNASTFSPATANSASGDAIFTITGIESSDSVYTITESTAPAGYYGMAGAITFKVTNGVITDVEYPDGTVTWDKDTSTFTVTNTPGVELPSTGGAGTLPYTIGGLLLMAASLLYGFGQRRKGERGDAI